MRRTLLALFATLAATGGAAAYCPSFPDSAATHNLQNQQELMLCHQRELAEAFDARQREAEIRASIEAQVRLLEMQRRMQAAAAYRPI